MSKPSKGSPKRHTHQNIDSLASRLLRISKNPDVRSVAGTALSDTWTTPKAHKPVAHTSTQVASTAGELLATQPRCGGPERHGLGALRPPDQEAVEGRASWRT